MRRLRHLTWLRWSQARSCRGPIPAKNCSATWNTAAESAKRQLALCQTNRLTGCAGSPGESCPLRSFSCTICAMCRSTARNSTCSWDSRRGKTQDGYPRLSKKLLLVEVIVLKLHEFDRTSRVKTSLASTALHFRLENPNWKSPVHRATSWPANILILAKQTSGFTSANPPSFPVTWFI